MRTISEYGLAKAIIESPDFAPWPMAEKYREISARTGIDFAGATAALGMLPPFLTGELHQTVRKRMATLISSSRKAQRAVVDQRLGEMIPALFRPGQSVDLVEDFARPLWNAVSARILGHDDSEEADRITALGDTIPTLFSPTASLTKRKAISDRITDYVGDDSDRMVALCLSALGAKPFVGSFALSIFGIVESHGAAPARDIAWPATYPESALRYIDRIALRDTAVSGCPFSTGDMARNEVRGANYSDAEKKELLFGAGGHTCLGAAISQHAWTRFVEHIAGLDVTLRAVSMAISPTGDPFHSPVSAMLAVERP